MTHPRLLLLASLLFVAAGAGIGILAFSRLLSWLLKHYENPTIALLVGFMVGSLRLIAFRMTHLAEDIGDGQLAYSPLELGGAQIGVAAGFAIAGFLLVSLLDHLQTRNNPVFRLFARDGAGAVAMTES